MSQSLTFAVIVGSLRKGSFSRMAGQALIARAPEGLSGRIVEIGELNAYNEDLDENPPSSWVRLRDEVRQRQAVLFVTPEYNRSIPGVLKNALDVGSRPYGQSVWAGLPAAVVSITPHKLGAFGANHALRQTFVFLDMPVMQQPEAYIGGAAELFGEGGEVKNADTDKFLRKFMESFAAWIQAVRTLPKP